VSLCAGEGGGRGIVSGPVGTNRTAPKQVDTKVEYKGNADVEGYDVHDSTDIEADMRGDYSGVHR
jgi:hypothetical protein